MSSPDMSRWLERYEAACLGVFGQPALVLARGQGSRVWDIDGREYLDLFAGIAVNALGHAHPAVVAAIAEQAGRLGHVSNFFSSPPHIELAERLLDKAAAPAGSRVFVCNSGTEAVEAALKMTRRTGRSRVIALEGAFHGRTLGALSLTAKDAYREPFEPLPGGVVRLPFGDIAALEAAMSDDVAAVFLEVIQGEGGVRPVPPGYLAAARQLTTTHGALLVLDEVQTGIGRTGAWFAHQLPELSGELNGANAALQPDIMTLAKGLGGGMPIGAVVAFGPRASGLLKAGDHGTTFGGNPMAAAAALAVIRTIEEEDLCERVRDLGAFVTDRLQALSDPRIVEVRGAGLLLGVALSEPIAPAVVAAARSRGYLLNATDPLTLRLAPALTTKESDIAGFVAALPSLLDAAWASNQPAPTPGRATASDNEE